MSEKAPKPNNEKERLEALQSYHIMDSENEDIFDSITQLASYICQTPIALVTLLDENRQWFKSKIGLEVSETPRNISFCQHAIIKDEVYEVFDALENDIFKNNPLVTSSPDIRFYAGAPLKTADGFKLGTLCVIDTKPRKLTAEQKNALVVLGKQVIELIEIRKKNSELKKYQNEILELNRTNDAIINSTNYAIISTNIEGLIQTFNKGAESMLGYNANEVVNNLFSTALFNPIELADKAEQLSIQFGYKIEPDASMFCSKNISESNITIELSFIKKDGKKIPIELSSSVIIGKDDNVTGYMITAKDISERKYFESRIVEDEKKFSKIFKTNPVGIAISSNENGEFVDVNDSFLQMIGREKHEVIGFSTSDINLVSASASSEMYERAKKNENANDFELAFTTKLGETRIGIASTELLILKEKEFRVTTLSDITKRKKLEQQLQESEERYSKVFKASPVGISISNFDNGQFLEMNDYFLKMIERERDDVIGKTAVDINLVDAETRMQMVQQALKPNTDKGEELTFYKKSGKSVISIVSTEIIVVNNQKCLLTIAYDITERKKLEELVKTSEEKFNKVFRTNPSGIAISKVEDGKFTETNDAFLKLLGKTSQEVVGYTSVELNLIDSNKRDKIKETIKKTGSATNIELNFYSTSGELKTALFSSELFKLKEENYFLITTYDITERKLAEEKIRQLLEFQLAVNDSTDLSIITIDLNGIIQSFNKGAEKMLGYRAEELIGMSSPAIYNDTREADQRAERLKQSGKKIVHNFQVFEDNEKEIIPETNERTYIRKDGTKLTVQLSLTVIKNKNGEVTGYMGISEVITQRKKAENDIRESLKLMEQSINLRETFLANMSHEVRTPMNAIIGFTNLLQKSKLEEKEREYVKTIKSSGENLLRIINDILDVSKIQSGVLTFEEQPIDLRQIFMSLNAMLLHKTLEKKITLSFNCSDAVPEIVVGDPTRLTQIILNLVGNALKFTLKGTVEIKAELIETQENNFRISFAVKDSGIGIAHDKLDEIFERFKQAGLSTTRNYGGTGLGLSIAKDLIELQSGSITVSSIEGVGSVFTFILPFKKNEDLIPVEAYKENKIDIIRLRKKNILLVEDNPVNIKLVVSLFEFHNLKIDIATNGKIAVDKVKNGNFDLVLMDIEMPEMNGYEAAKAIRIELKNPVPIIAMTAHAMAGEMNKCLSAGMNDYISKPINEELLLKKMFNASFLDNPENSLNNIKQKLVNLSSLVEQVRGKKEVILEIIDLIIKQISEDIPNISSAISNMDYITVKRLSHNMKSTVFALNIAELGTVLDEMESLAATGKEKGKIVSLFSKLIGFTNQIIDELNLERLNYI